MNDKIPTLGIRFDIDKVNSGDYGGKCWLRFWLIMDIQKLRGVTLFEGDTSATALGKENVYCIAIQSPSDATFNEIQSAFEQDIYFQEMAAMPPFVRGKDVINEPLIESGYVDALGELIGGINSKPALEAIRDMRESEKQK